MPIVMEEMEIKLKVAKIYPGESCSKAEGVKEKEYRSEHQPEEHRKHSAIHELDRLSLMKVLAASSMLKKCKNIFVFARTLCTRIRTG